MKASPKTSVFLAVPHYGELVTEALPSLMTASERSETCRISLNTNGASLLAFNFNLLWCGALNRRKERKLTHFAMHHADIQAEVGWLDKLVDEMASVCADILSVVIPIKDEKGLTSTGMQDPVSLQIRRLTMREVHRLPPTFDAADVASELGWARPDQHLMINTGLWICDFTKPWVEKAYFEILDRIVRMPDGRFCANVLPEDWNFSGWCARQGLRVFATSSVPAHHYGRARFSNTHDWGDWETDKGDER